MPRGRRTFANGGERPRRVRHRGQSQPRSSGRKEAYNENAAHYRSNSPHEDPRVRGLPRGKKNMSTWPSFWQWTMCWVTA